MNMRSIVVGGLIGASAILLWNRRQALPAAFGFGYQKIKQLLPNNN
ncbi:MAG: hypothetical protein KGO83_01490 [Paenibacillaceae bacterium]|jgi:hypothetical protein|nr:hypothetical protein [Paenibacillaceae bacterium]